MAKVFTEYIIDTTQAKASLDGMKREVRELQGAEGSSQKTFQTNAQKRAQLLKEEQQDLIELRKRRDAAYTPKQINLYNKRIAETEKRVRNLKGEYGKLERGNKSLMSSFQKVGAAIGVAFGIREILRFTKQAAELSAEAEGVRTAFERVGGTASMLQDLQRATRGTVEQLELMRLSVQASNFNIPLEHLGNLFEFATNRAIETGQSVDKLVADITLGLGRKSMRVLDNLGLSWTDMQAAVAEAGDFTTGIINVINQDLGKMGDVADTNLTKIQRSQAALKDATLAFGDVAAPVYAEVLDLITKAIQGFTALSTGMSKVDIEEYAAAQDRLNAEMEGLRKAAVGAADAQDFYRDRLEKVRQEIIARGKADATLEDAFRAILTVTIQKRQATEDMLKTDKLAAMNATQYTRAMIEQIPVLKQLLQQTKEGNLAREESVPEMRTIASIQEEIKEKQERMNTEVAAGSAEFHKLNREIIALTKEMESYTKVQETLLEQLEKLGPGIDPIADQLDMVSDIIATMPTDQAAEHIKGLIAEFENVAEMERFVEGLEKMFLSLHDAPDALEGLEEFTAFIDGMEGEEEKIMALRSAIAGLGEDSPALKAALQGQLDELTGNAESQRETLLDTYVRSEEEVAEKSLEVAAQLAEALLRIGFITQEQYKAIIEGIQQQLDDLGDDTEDKVAEAIASFSGLGAGIVGVFKDIYSATATDAQKNAAFIEQLTTFQILLDQASAIASAVSAAAKGSVTAVDLAIKIAAAVGTVIAAIARATSIKNQAQMPARPSFAYGGEIQGKPHTQGGVPIEAERGEYIVKSSAYAKAKEAVHAINSERFDTYVTQHYIEPLLKSKQLAREDNDRGFARNIAESLHLDGKAEHYLKQIARKGNNARIENWDELARLMKKDNWGSTY